MFEVSSRLQVQDKRPQYLPEDDRNVCENKAQNRQEARVRLGRGQRRCLVGE